MRKIISALLLFLACLPTFAQISQRCPVCPPSLKNVPSGWCLKDSAGFAVWQPCDSGTVGTGTPTQVTYFGNDGYITGNSSFTRTDTTTNIINGGDTITVNANGSIVDYNPLTGGYTKASGTLITDFSTFGNYAWLTRDGFLLGDITGSKYLFPHADGSANQVLKTDGAGQLSFGNLPSNPTIFSVNATNGLTKVNDSTLELGGTVYKNTGINVGQYSLNFQDDSMNFALGKLSSSVYGANLTGTDFSATLRNNAAITAKYFNVITANGDGISIIDTVATSGIFGKVVWGGRDTASSGGGFYADRKGKWSGGFYNFIYGGQPHAQLFYGALDANGNTVDLVRIEANPDEAHGRFITDTAIGKYNGWRVGATYAQLEFDKTGEDGQATGINLTVDSSGVSIINGGVLAFKVNTTGTKISMPNVPAYANNTLAVAAIGAGKLYYTDVAGEYVLKLSH